MPPCLARLIETFPGSVGLIRGERAVFCAAILVKFLDLLIGKDGGILPVGLGF